MARPPTAAIPTASRMTLLEWIETDDGDTASTRSDSLPAGDALHARLFAAIGRTAEPLQPPAGLRLAPLG